MTTAPARPAPVQFPPHIGGCLKPAIAHAQAGRLGLALECVAAAAVADIQHHQQTFLSDASRAALLCDLYAELFSMAGITPHAALAGAAIAPSQPLRLLYIVSSLVDGQAASANIARLCQLHHPARFDPHILCVEEFTQRRPALGFLKYPDAPSARVGAKVIASLPSGSLTLLEPTGDLLAGAREAIAAARSLRPQIAVFVGSPACPVQAACAFARVAPRQINMNIGVPLPVRGIDHIVYNSPRRQAQDQPHLAPRNIASSSVETSGGDARAGLAAIPEPRGPLGVPADALLLVSAGNRLPQRMLAGSFASDLAAFLASRPDVWWVGVGPGDFTDVLRLLGPRAVAAGPRADIRGVVKAADIYLNEYPEGGGNTIIEAMGCATPVVAGDFGLRHAQHIGAALSDHTSITSCDAYWREVERLAANPVAREALGQRQQRRALESLDYHVIALAYEREFVPAAAAARAAIPA
ncbi:MAG: glycosyltransferase [Tepidisphaera sp.]|nr:glycosyltransferase [Tepidisphaera sp.]